MYFKSVTVPVLWLLLFGVTRAAAADFSRGLTVCFDDRIRVGQQAIRAFDHELAALTASMVRVERGTHCSGSERVKVSVRMHAPERYGRALGLAYTRQGRVLPVVELYAANLTKTLNGQASASLFGRALARVAYHELQHYLRQEAHHDTDGLFVPSLSASDLIAFRAR